MGIALCHSIPRDVFAYIALLLLFIGFILQIGAIGSHGSKTGAGYITLKGESKKQALAYMALHPALYGTVAAYDASSGVTTYSLDTATQVCDPSGATLTFHCARFAEAYHTVNGIALASFISAVLAFVFGMFVTGRCSHKTADILGRFVLALSVPTALQCALIGLFFVRIVGNAKQVVRVSSVRAAGGSVSFHRGFGPALMITSTVLFCVAFLLVLVRWLVVLCTRLRLKRSAASNPRDAERMKDMHLVNDDWQRQKQILRSHARSVQVEMLIKEEPEEREQEWDRDRHPHHDHAAPIADEDAFGVTFRRKHAAEAAEAAETANRENAAEAAAAQQAQEQHREQQQQQQEEEEEDASAFQHSDFSPSSHAEQQDNAAAAEARPAKAGKDEKGRAPTETHDPHEL